MPADISFLGDKELARKLKRLEDKAARDVVKPAAKSAGVPVLAAAKSKVPADRGRLRDGLKLSAFSRKSGVGASVKTPTRKKLGIPADAKGYYPASLEYGWTLRVFGSKFNTRVMPATPYLRPALDENATTAKNIMIREIRQGLIRLARR